MGDEGKKEEIKVPSEQNTLLKVMVGLLVILVVFLGFISGHQYYNRFLDEIKKVEHKDSITLVSPNGHNRILIQARDDKAGIWITQVPNDNIWHNARGPQVVLSNGDTGAEVGIYNGFNDEELVGVVTDSTEPYPLLQGIDRKGIKFDILHRIPRHSTGQNDTGNFGAKEE